MKLASIPHTAILSNFAHQKKIGPRYALKKAEQQIQESRSKMGFETRKSMILDQYANPLEVKNER